MYEDFRLVAGIITVQVLAIIVIDLTGLLWGSNNRMWSKYSHFIYPSIHSSIHSLQREVLGGHGGCHWKRLAFISLLAIRATARHLDSGRFVSTVDRSGLLLRCQVILLGSLYLLFEVPWVVY